MVANYKETVRFHEETVKFRNATDWLKDFKSVKFYEIQKALGLKDGQMDMIRAFRRRVKKEEIKTLVEKYPETVQFFTKEKENDSTSALDTQTLNEPMGTHFYAKKDVRDETIEVQRKLIAKLEEELAAVKERLLVVEAEKKTLVEIVSHRKQ